MMQWNDQVREQLLDYVSTVPAVLCGKDDEPYEYRETEGSINRLKRRRMRYDLPYQLYTFLLENGISLQQCREFASGLFLNFCESTGIYV